MTIIEIIDTFTFYGIDVMLLASLTAMTVQVFKLTFLKRLKRKLLTFLPFVLGTLFYAAYSALVKMDLAFLLTEYTQVIEHGVSVGALATLLYVLYEQFVRDEKSVSAAEGVIATLIEGYVPKKSVAEVAALIAEAIEKDVTGDGAKRAAQILTERMEEGVTERDIQLLAKLIIETLAHMTAG